MIEYDLIITGCHAARQRLQTLLDLSHDEVEAAHLNAAIYHATQLENTIKMARECFDNPRRING